MSLGVCAFAVGARSVPYPAEGAYSALSNIGPTPSCAHLGEEKDGVWVREGEGKESGKEEKGIGGATTKFLGVQICCPRPTFYKQATACKPQHYGIGHKQKSRVLYLHYAQLLITTINEVQL